MNKTCYHCKETKPLGEFHRDKTTKDGFQSICKLCSKARLKVYYEKNKEKELARKAKAVVFCRRLVSEYLATHPCVDCGNDDIRVLEFDHVRGEKVHGVGYMAGRGYGERAILEEIAKCEVRCSNCHAIKTYERIGGTWHDEYRKDQVTTSRVV